MHAPGSYLTYEPQWNSDVNSVYENVVAGEVYPYEFLVENCPEDRKHDIDYVISLMDWEKNVDPHYRKHYFRPPLVASAGRRTMSRSGSSTATGYIAAKELTVVPGQPAYVAKDRAAYGCILTQGHGRLGSTKPRRRSCCASAAPRRDEFFVSEQAARAGVRVVNRSPTEPLVMLKHFGPNAGDPQQV